MAGILNEFVQNTKILASQVNENFAIVQNDMEELGNGLNTIIANEITKAKSDLLTDIQNVSNGKADLSLSNINETAKEMISTLGKPNYAAGVSKAWNTQYTATQNGWIRASCTCGTKNRNHWWYLTIGGVRFQFYNSQGDWDIDGDSVLLPVAKGQTYIATEGQDWKELSFFPDLTT